MTATSNLWEWYTEHRFWQVPPFKLVYSEAHYGQDTIAFLNLIPVRKNSDRPVVLWAFHINVYVIKELQGHAWSKETLFSFTFKLTCISTKRSRVMQFAFLNRKSFLKLSWCGGHFLNKGFSKLVYQNTRNLALEPSSNNNYDYHNDAVTLTYLCTINHDDHNDDAKLTCLCSIRIIYDVSMPLGY